MDEATDSDRDTAAPVCCGYCGKEIPNEDRRGPKNRYCDSKCRWRNRAKVNGQAAKAARQRQAKCPECNETFTTSNSLRVYCGETCRQRVLRRPMDARRRAMRRDRAHEKVDPFEVFERDGWHCHLCGKSTPRRLRGTFEDRAPELDHIVPLAAGGDHTYANTACSCRKCNRAKGATPMGQPRLDFGPLPINQHA